MLMWSLLGSLWQEAWQEAAERLAALCRCGRCGGPRRWSFAGDDPGGGADDNVPGEGSINSVVHELDDPGGGNADDDPGGGSTTSADADSALNVSNTSKTSSSPLPSSFATGLSSSRVSSSIVATGGGMDESDDEDVDHKSHFCSECSKFHLLAGGVGGCAWYMAWYMVCCTWAGSWVWG